MGEDEMDAIVPDNREDEDLAGLRREHRRLDAEIEALQLQGESDLKLMTLKRKKLQIRDSIAWIMTRARPDIIA